MALANWKPIGKIHDNANTQNQALRVRVALLYLGSAGVFACQHCYRLVYASQREAADHRAMRQAGKIRARLGWRAGIANPNGGKSKGMDWRIFNRLTAEHDALVGVSVAGTAKRLGQFERRA